MVSIEAVSTIYHHILACQLSTNYIKGDRRHTTADCCPLRHQFRLVGKVYNHDISMERCDRNFSVVLCISYSGK